MNRNDYKNQYNQMVKEINRQIRRLEKADPESVTLERYRNYYQPVTSKNPDYRMIRKLYSSAKKLLSSNELSLESQARAKANAIETLHREGMDYINKRNFNSYMRFMEDARSRGLASLYSSTQIIEAIHEAKSKGLTDSQIKANIKRWSNQMKRDREGRIIEQIEPKKLKIR